MMADRIPLMRTASRKHGSNKARNVPHLKPLSIYSHMVFQEAIKSFSGNQSLCSERPSRNSKDVLSNGRGSVRCKRRLDDSFLDETYDTPGKKPRLDKYPSADSGYVINSFNASRQVHLDPLQSSSVVLDMIKKVEKTFSDQKSLGWINATDTTDGQNSASLPDVNSSSLVMVDSTDVLAFDYDVEEIMRLSPIESVDVSADRVEDFIQSCHSYEEQSPAQEGSSSWCSSRRKPGILECSLGGEAHPGSDEGYVTKSYYTADAGESKVTAESELSKDDFIKSFKITILNCLPEDKSPLVSTPIKSTPLGNLREYVKRSPILGPKSHLHKECQSPTVTYESVSSISLSEYVDTRNNKALPTIHFRNVNESQKGVVVPEGTPIHKSSVCLDQENLPDTHEDEDVLSVSQQQELSKTEVAFWEESNATDSFESTLPLQVQVKSKVVLISPPQPEVTAHQKPEKNTASVGKTNSFKDVPRPVVLYREEDWEKEKAAYVNLVMRHMTDNTEDGVMTELLHLMNSVANQGKGSDERKWQHPSDLTRRNYRLRNSNRLLSMDEWQNLNYRNHRRFAEVPQVFKRSPVL